MEGVCCVRKAFEKNLSSRKRDVVVFSVFGRGHWLAVELSTRLKLDVSLVDLSKSMGYWGPEDWEGPFGLFRSESLKSSQQERLDEESHSEPISQGFTIWSKGGPMELKGPLTSYLLQKSEISQTVQKYLKEYEDLEFSQKKSLIQRMNDKKFKNIWLAHLAHQLTSNAYRPNASGLDYGVPLPIFSLYYTRKVSRRGYQRSLKWCETQGVKTFPEVELISFQSRKMRDQKYEKIKIRDSNGHIKNLISQMSVWMLSGEETDFLNPRLSKILYPKGTLKASWSWMHFRIRLDGKACPEVLPDKFVMIEELNLPWTHSNLCFVEKNIQTDFDVWLRVPIQHRFRKEYLKNIGQDCLRVFGKRIPGSQAKILNMPQDYIYEQRELGPPRHPIYKFEDLKRCQSRLRRKLRFRNVYFDGPEHWESLDWLGQFQSQNILFEKIKAWVQKERGEHQADL